MENFTYIMQPRNKSWVFWILAFKDFFWKLYQQLPLGTRQQASFAVQTPLFINVIFFRSQPSQYLQLIVITRTIE